RATEILLTANAKKVGGLGQQLNAAALGLTAAVVGNRRHVANQRNLQASGGDRAQRRLTARARPLHQHLHVLQAVLHGLSGSVTRGDLRGERSRLAAALEPARTSG